MAKITPKKSVVVQLLSDLISKSKSVAVVDYQGMKVSQATLLRQDIKKAGGQYVVAKNTLFKVASGLKDLDLSGISGFVFSLTDEISPLKAVADFTKKHQVPRFKLGILGDKVLSAAEVTQLSATPDKKTLISKLLGSIKSPVYGLVYNLNWPVSQLVRTLDAVRAKKEVTNSVR